MPRETTAPPAHLVDRVPTLTGAEMIAQLVPPRQFQQATLDSYRPDRDYPSQGAAVAAVRTFIGGFQSGGGRLFGRRKESPSRPGIYLDGGFGVGKTHLLAAAWHLAPGRKYFGTFIEYTALVGALGYQATVDLLRGASLLAIDEFELDDPGDTRLMARLLGELVTGGTRVAATSNTPPNALGEGRFAAQDFLREIDSLAAKFETVRIDGLDYRRRDVEAHARVSQDVVSDLSAIDGPTTVDEWAGLLSHLSQVHPSRYVRLVDGVAGVGFTDVTVFSHQSDALRFVAFVDRLYDAQVRIVASGVPLDQVFPDDMLGGGYRKKYLRAMSRIVALTTAE